LARDPGSQAGEEDRHQPYIDLQGVIGNQKGPLQPFQCEEEDRQRGSIQEKVPRRAGLIVEAAGHQYALTLNAEALAVGSLKLPDVEEAESPRVVFEERVAMLRDLNKSIDALFDTFLKTRASSAWEGYTSGVRRWIVQTAKAAA
jgi:hypothetical protein